MANLVEILALIGDIRGLLNDAEPHSRLTKQELEQFAAESANRGDPGSARFAVASAESMDQVAAALSGALETLDTAEQLVQNARGEY